MKKIERSRNSGRWTEARWRSYIVSSLRTASLRWGPRIDRLKSAACGKALNPATGRLRTIYRCEDCRGEFARDEVKIDHIEPAVDPDKGWQSWDEYITRMFPEVEGFQILCEICHKEKTKKENEQRKENRKKAKQRRA